MPLGDASAWLLALYGALILLAAALVRHAPGEPRARLRRGVLLYGLYALVVALRAAAGERIGDELATTLRDAASVLALLLAVHLGALVLFDVVLRAVRLR